MVKCILLRASMDVDGGTRPRPMMASIHCNRRRSVERSDSTFACQMILAFGAGGCGMHDAQWSNTPRRKPQRRPRRLFGPRRQPDWRGWTHARVR